jgi:hypothetical protein
MFKIRHRDGVGWVIEHADGRLASPFAYADRWDALGDLRELSAEDADVHEILFGVL